MIKFTSASKRDKIHHKWKREFLVPKSKRFCLTCQAMTWFKYNPETKHSACTQCGDWKATKHPALVESKKMKKKMKKEVKKNVYVFELLQVRELKVIGKSEDCAREQALKQLSKSAWQLVKLKRVEPHGGKENGV